MSVRASIIVQREIFPGVRSRRAEREFAIESCCRSQEKMAARARGGVALRRANFPRWNDGRLRPLSCGTARAGTQRRRICGPPADRHTPTRRARPHDTADSGDMAAALRAAKAAGCAIARVEVGKDGRIVIVLMTGEERSTGSEPGSGNEWDEILK